MGCTNDLSSLTEPFENKLVSKKAIWHGMDQPVQHSIFILLEVTGQIYRLNNNNNKQQQQKTEVFLKDKINFIF